MQVLYDSGNYMENVYGLAMAAVAILSLVVGLWVVVRERARRVSLSFLASAVAVAVYLLSFSFMLRSATADVAYLWAKAGYVGVPFIVPALYHFSMDLLGIWRERLSWIMATWAVGVVYAVLAVGTGVLVPGVEEAPWGFYTQLTLWNLPFLVWSFLILALVIEDYWRAYREAGPVQKARIRWLAIPLVVASLGFLDYGPSLGFHWPPVGFIFLSVFLLGAARVVARYHFPDLTPAFAADQILRTMVEPLLVVDPLGRVAIANSAAARLLGWSVEELRGKPLPALVGADAAVVLWEGPSLHGEELEVEARTGEPIALSVSTNDLVVQGRTVGTVIVARDIRERRRAAERLRRREEYFRALIENARDTISVLDAEGRVLYMSPSHEEILGRRPGGYEGKSVFGIAHPDDRRTVHELFTDLLDDPGGTARTELRVAHVSGKYRVMEIRAQNLLDHPAVQGVVVNGRDITDERHLEEQLQRSQRLEAIGRLAGGIAHDFNNVLTTIQGNVALMEEAVPEDSELASGLEVVGASAERAGRLTRQLLNFSRRQLTYPELLDLNQVVDELRSMFEQTIGEGSRVVIRTAADLGRVRVDRSQLEQALVDLVLNAREAMDQGGRFEVTTENVELTEAEARKMPVEAGPYVRLTVADEGRGMDEATRTRVFDPFFTTKESDLDAGLGLATVYGTVRQADGHIDVESEPGRGTRFSIYLPRIDIEPAASAATGGGGREPEREGRGEVVLVVEDEAPVRSLIIKVLKRKGYEVLDAPDGETALELAVSHRGPIDLLIADLVMPGITGREVAEALTAADPAMATILISGYTADEVVRDGISRGEYVFIPKPFSPATLTAQVAEVLRARQAAGPGDPQGP